MAFFHLRSLPGLIWPPVPRMETSQLWLAYQELTRTQWLPPAELERQQLLQLRALLLHCIHQVPYYRRLLIEAGLAERPIESLEEFRRLPLLTRELCQTHAADLEARHLPAGTLPSKERFTSGTNGVPIQVLGTNRVDLWWFAFYLRDLEWCGIDPRGRLAFFRFLAKTPEELPQALAGIELPFWSQTLNTLVQTGPSYGMDMRQEPRLQLAWLRRIDPDYLLGFPSSLEFLASLIQESGQRLPKLRTIQTIGETLSDETRERIETGFGVPVKNLYSSSEAGYMASQCPEGHGLHVHSENVLVEVLDAENRPCLPGQTGRLVFTTLQNFRKPLLRYDILDDVTLAKSPCRCGRGLPLLTRVEGRRHPLLHLPDGRRRVITGLYRQIRLVGGSRQFQVIQRAVDHVIVRMVPDQAWTAEHAERVRQIVQKELEAPIRVDVEAKERLEVPPGGKLKIGVVEIEG
jgi:phenylacetate-CoA ligase